MNRILLIIACLLLIITGWLFYDRLIRSKTTVDQRFDGFNGPCLSTRVWYKNYIIKTWDDPLDSVIAHPEIKKHRRKQGEEILSKIKSIE